ncbi:NitT/TauT family transport system substrate-binding protein [Amycolatopsis arida]|uniref:NitT/TauT family transport system substrate-binding protein n=1 Tax=Amycolatopsis arida TaxID=587909 RepID=A0A1I5QR48_9PSEU|nr:ABC transporter substrate-binding protein [Amycolatopsis arida]TDX98927.1 NitT/TauT family transport system substrate-binding protein [Amycolatopsis arida]SFP48537.1 NitT/TauT family transport system substrate-binding protein [Amycolatopsis arida]
MRAGARLVLAPLMALVTLSGCALVGGSAPAPPAPPERDTLRVGVGSAIDTAPLRMAVADGLFQRGGLRVELVEQPSQDEALAMLAAGRLDVAFASNVALFKAAAEGTELQLQGEAYTAGRTTMALMRWPGSTYTEPDEKRSPRIAVDAPDDLGTLATRSALHSSGVDPERIRFVVLPADELVPALRDGDVDAAWMMEPQITQVQKEFGARVLVDCARGATLDFPVSSYATTASFAQANRRTMELFRELLGQAQRYGADSVAVRRALPGLADIDETTAALVSLGDYPVSPNGVRLQRVADLMHSSGLLTERLDVPALLPAAVPR